MSIHNRYADVPLTEEDFTTFDAQFAIIEQIMGALEEPNRLILRRVAKLGFKSDTFTRDALMLAAKHEELLPRGLDVQELEAQFRLRDELKSRALQMKLMARKMEKIVQLLGSDVFSGALAAYKSMKANHRGTLDEQLRELGRIFRNRKKGAGKDEGPESKDEGPETRDEGQRQPPPNEPSTCESAAPQSGGRERLPSEDNGMKTLRCGSDRGWSEPGRPLGTKDAHPVSADTADERAGQIRAASRFALPEGFPASS